MPRKHLIELNHVRVRNLKNISVHFYFGEIILLTGPSGSGKSSLAFDTLFAAGHRQYASTLNLSEYFQLPQAPEVDDIKGLSPTIAIHRHSIKNNNPYSTVGTMTKIHDYLKIIFSLIGIIRNPLTKQPVSFGSKEKFLKEVLSLPEGSTVQITVAIHSTQPLETLLGSLIQKGFSKVIYDNTPLSLYRIHEILPSIIPSKLRLLIDTTTIKPSNTSRIATSLFRAFEEGLGTCYITYPNGEEKELSLTTNIPLSLPLSPQDFSHKTYKGRCPSCLGLGSMVTLNRDTAIQEQLSIAENACIPAGKYQTAYYKAVYDALADTYHFSLETPWKDLPESIKEIFLYGVPDKYLEINLFKKKTYTQWRGIVPEIAEKYLFSPSKKLKNKLANYLKVAHCATCDGTGYHPWISNVTVGEKTLPELLSMPISILRQYIENLSLDKIQKELANEVIQKLINKASLMDRLGLGYLSCNRSIQSLSGGEARRTLLAKQISFGPVGVIYILDEPSIGLHPLDTQKLSSCIQALKAKGNTIILVDHYDHSFAFADRVIDIGPGAGIFGGEILFNGTPEKFLRTADSTTAKFLRKEIDIELPKKRRTSEECLRIENITTNNLKNISLTIPKGLFISITGVSGSGKSSLINDTLVPVMETLLKGESLQPLFPNIRVYGQHIFNHIVNVNQKAPGKNKRSIPATYIGVFDLIRELFAKQPIAKQFGLTRSSFSFNASQHICASCLGTGESLISESFEEYTIQCSSCRGKRFSPRVLSVTYKNKNISDILNMTAFEAESFFQDTPAIHEKIYALIQIGLGHLQLGRSLSSLSEGECQRLKLAAELLSSKKSQKSVLYVLDEPTTGLHTQDIKALIDILYRFTEMGHTVVVVEHNAHVIKMSDLIIDLGPVGGPSGGFILYEGTPEQLIETSSATGRFLAPYLFPSCPVYTNTSIQHHPLPTLPDIEIIQAQKNNLNKICATIKRNAFNVICGPIASGKHSLAVGTLYAEGRYNYADLLPPYLANLLPPVSPSECKEICGLSPIVALSAEDMYAFEKTKKKAHAINKSLAKVVGVYDLIKLLFLTIGTPYDPKAQRPLQNINEESIANDLLNNYPNAYVTIIAPFQSKDIETEFYEKQKMGYVKFFGNKKIFDVDDFPIKNVQEPGVVINHLLISEKNHCKIAQSFSLAFDLSEDQCLFLISDKQNPPITTKAHKGLQNDSGELFPQPSTEVFSEESPLYACERCFGYGTIQHFHLFPHKERLEKFSAQEILTHLFPNEPLLEEEKAVARLGISFTDKISSLTPKQQNTLLFGTETLPGLESLLSQKFYTAHHNEEELSFIHHFLSKKICPICSGTGLGAYALSFQIEGYRFIDILKSTFSDIEHFCNPEQYSTSLSSILLPIKQKLHNILTAIKTLKVDTLSLLRPIHTLSRSELYRAYVVSKTSNLLSDIIYIFETPSEYIHPQDIPSLSAFFKQLKTQRNTIIATERNPLLTNFADHNIYLGPLSGPNGGTICSHPPKQNNHKIPQLAPRKGQWLIIKNLSIGENTLLSVKAPLNNLVSITGPSASGTTTLLYEGFYKECQRLIGATDSTITNIVHLDAKIEKTLSRSDIGTYLDISPLLRKFFASLPQAISKNLTVSAFSANTKKGMCSACFGTGKLYTQPFSSHTEEICCPECHGFMLNPISLSVQYNNKHFGEILRLPVDALSEMFPFLKKLTLQIKTMHSLGIGYLSLERKLSSLSIGERQLVEIVKVLCKKNNLPTAYFLDNLSTKLDDRGTLSLATILQRLVSEGHSVFCVDHNPVIIEAASYHIDLG